jgi:argininosuccinate lyase
MNKLWGGRFAEETDALVARYNASLPFDLRLADEDIDGSIAWARGLVGVGVLAVEEAERIVAGLEMVRAEFAAGEFVAAPGDEDIHTAVERRLTELLGPLAGRLHTGRSRNDQVATDFRLWVMRAVDGLLGEVEGLQRALLASAEAGLHAPMPGYTHLQPAQPVTWGHWALSHFWPLERDRERLRQALAAASALPLGSGALAGSGFPVDRAALAQALGFDGVAPNSIDAVADRDFAADFLYACAMMGVHLARLSEQLILFATAEFGFVVLPDAYSTGSSLMPQKKNPDTLELTRGKAGRLTGHLTGLLATLKGLPSAYDKDLQEDKEPVFDAYDTLALALPVMAGLVAALALRPERMRAALAQAGGGLYATDVADYLVEKGVPFREAHALVGRAVRRAEALGAGLDALPLAEWQAISELLGEEVPGMFAPEAALERRRASGGTAREALLVQVAAARGCLNIDRAD